MPPMNFGVSDMQMATTIEKMEYGKISQSFLIVLNLSILSTLILYLMKYGKMELMPK